MNRSNEARTGAARFAGICLLLCPVLFTFGAGVATRFMARQYTSRALVDLKPDGDLTGMFLGEPVQADAGFIEAQSGMIASAEVLDPVIDGLELIDKWSPSPYAVMSRENAAARLREMLRVSHPGDKGLLEIAVTDNDSNEAAAVANAIASTYRKRRIEERVKELNETLAKEDRDAQQLRRNAQEASEAAAKISASNSTAAGSDNGENSAPLADRVPREEQALATATQNIDEMKAQLSDAEKMTIDDLPKWTDTRVVSDATLRFLTEYQDLTATENGLVQSGVEDDPRLVQLRERKAALQKLLDDAVDAIKTGLQNSIDTAQQDMERQQAVYAEDKKAMDALNADSQEYADAKKKYEDAKKLVDDAMRRIETGKHMLRNASPPVVIMQKAEPATAPSRPNAPLIMGASAGAGIPFAMLGAALLLGGLRKKTD